jgi:hypothetical protein
MIDKFEEQLEEYPNQILRAGVKFVSFSLYYSYHSLDNRYAVIRLCFSPLAK